MKIGFTGIDLPEGKTKYMDEKLIALEAKDKAKKVTPFFAEFIKDEFVQSGAIVVPKSNILDLLILDMDKIETRLLKLEEGDEKSLMTKCMKLLEQETPLCDIDFNDEEREILTATAPVSFEDYMNCHNFNDCKSKGVAKLVDRDHIIQPNDIIEIRFNV